MKLIRVLVYEGPYSWIERAVEKRFIREEGFTMADGSTVKETACVQLISAAEVHLEITLKEPSHG